MSFTPKSWQDGPSVTTPITAAALIDLETRLAAYADAAAAPQFRPEAYGAIGDGVHDDTSAIDAATSAAAALSGGEFNRGVVRLTAGRIYKRTTTWTIPTGVNVIGDGPDNTFVTIASDLGSGQYAIKLPAATTGNKCYLEGFTVKAPQVSVTIGVIPNQMRGIQVGSSNVLRHVVASYFYAGFEMTGDHNIFERSEAHSNYHGVYYDNKLTQGQNDFYSCRFDGNTLASVACSTTTSLSNDNYFDCHFGYGPYGIWSAGGPSFMFGCTFYACGFESVDNGWIYDSATTPGTLSVQDTKFIACGGSWSGANGQFAWSGAPWDYAVVFAGCRNVEWDFAQASTIPTAGQAGVFFTGFGNSTMLLKGTPGSLPIGDNFLCGDWSGTRFEGFESAFSSTRLRSVRGTVYRAQAAITANSLLESYNFVTTVRGNTETAQGFVGVALTNAPLWSTTASTTTGQNTLTVASATGIAPGQLIACAAFPAGTTVRSITGTTVALTQLATTTNASVAISQGNTSVLVAAEGHVQVTSTTATTVGQQAYVDPVTPTQVSGRSVGRLIGHFAETGVAGTRWLRLNSGTPGASLAEAMATRNEFTPEAYGAIGDGSHDDSSAIDSATSAAAAVAAGEFGRGIVRLSAGKTYKRTTAWNVPAGVSVIGGGEESTTVQWTTDLGSGNWAMTTNGSRTLVRDLTLMTSAASPVPGFRPQLGGADVLMGALKIGASTAYARLIIKYFNYGIGMNGDHITIDRVNLAQNYYGVYYMNGQVSNGNNNFTNCRITSNSFASLAAANANAIAGDIFIECHFGYGPFCFYNEGGTTFMLDCTFVQPNFEGIGNMLMYDAAVGAGLTSVKDVHMRSAAFAWGEPIGSPQLPAYGMDYTVNVGWLTDCDWHFLTGDKMTSGAVGMFRTANGGARIKLTNIDVPSSAVMFSGGWYNSKVVDIATNWNSERAQDTDARVYTAGGTINIGDILEFSTSHTVRQNTGVNGLAGVALSTGSTFSTTGNVTTGSPTITSVASFTGVALGMVLTGSGIPSGGTTIMGYNNGTTNFGQTTAANTILMSANGTSTTTASTVTGSSQVVVATTGRVQATATGATTAGTYAYTDGTTKYNVTGTSGGTKLGVFDQTIASTGLAGLILQPLR